MSVRHAIRGRKDLLVGALTALAAVVAHGSVLRNGFVNLDDPLQLTANERVLSGLSWDNALWSLGPESPCSPLTWLAYAAVHSAAGLQPWAFHGLSLALHVFNALLLYAFLRAATGESIRSALVAGLFAVHPVNVESVAWVAELNNVLSGLFFMLALWMYVLYARRPGWKRYAATLAMFGLGLLAKPVLMTLPFILLLFDFWPLKRFRPAGPGGVKPGRLVLEKVPFVAMSLASVGSTLLTVKEHAAFYTVEAVPLGLRLANALVSYLKYLGKLFWPADLALLYPYPGAIPLWKSAGAGIVLAVITASTLKAWRRRPYITVGWLWFLGTMIPFLGIVQAGLWPEMADRYAYLSFIGIFIVLVWGLSDAAAGLPWHRLLPAGVWAVVFVALTILSWQQTGRWRDSVSLFEHVVEVNPGSPVAHNSLGNGLLERGDIPLAVVHYREALRLDQASSEARFNLGLAHAELGEADAAMVHLRDAIRINPVQAEPHILLGTLLAEQGRFREAVVHAEEALRLDPESVEGLNAMGTVLMRGGRFKVASRYYAEALKVRPGQPEVLNNLGTAHAAQGRYAEAAAFFEQALSLQPGSGDARRNLDRARGLMERIRGEITRLEAEPDDLPGGSEHVVRLGNLFRGIGEFDRAEEMYRRAAEFRPADPDLAYTIACLSALRGEVPEALRWLREASARGFHNAELLRDDPDLASVRAAEGFNELVRSVDESVTDK